MDWNHIQELFHQALAKPPQQREAFLESACQGKREIIQEVRSLIQAQEGIPGFWEETAFELLDPEEWKSFGGQAEAHFQPTAGDPVGAYRLIRKIGTGGMGTVWLASSAEQPRVAMKFIQAGNLDSATLLRFRRETQALRCLNHPWIARWLDAGSLVDGRPYFIMEYVDGTDIVQNCRRKGLNLNSTLHLFLKVCYAVQHAHRNLILHRDIKPSNIFVTPDGEPKLLDFGVSKLLEPEGETADSTWTAAKGTPLTPEYSSPEQLRGESLTTASDIFSLGILLFELLAHERPWKFQSPLPGEMAKQLEQSPAPPVSKTLNHNSPATRPFRKRALKGDLDRIVAKALAPKPEDRYDSVSDLAQDVECYLKGYPLASRSGYFSAWLGSFWKRHRLQATAAAIALFSFVAASGYSLIQYQISKAEIRRADTVLEFLSNLLTDSDPYAGGNPDLTVGTLLERGAEQIEAGLVKEPHARSSLLEVMGVAFTNLGRYELAQNLLQRGLHLNTELYGARSLHTGQALQDLGFLAFQQGQFELAEDYLRRAAEILDRYQDLDSKSYVNCLNHLGMALRGTHQLRASEEWHRQALLLDRKYQTGLFSHIANNLASVLFEQDRLQEAETLLQEAIQLESGEAYADRNPNLATNWNNLGMVLSALGEHPRAWQAFERALNIFHKALDPSHPEIAGVYMNQAGLAFQQEDLEQAVTQLQKAEQLYQRAIEDHRIQADHGDAQNCRTNLAVALHAQGRLPEAISALERALEAFAKSVPKYRTARIWHLHGQWLLESSQKQKAGQSLDRALALYSIVSSPEDPEFQHCQQLRQTLDEEMDGD